MEQVMTAIPRLTEQQAQELVLTTVATHAEALLRVAYRHSLCADDAHDAYQRSMEILLRRASTLDPKSAHKWLTVVVKREAMEVRRSRGDAVASGDLNYDDMPAETSSPEERAMSADRTTRAAEALQRLKPQELRALWLKALGHSYEDQLGHADPGSAATLALTYTAPPPAPPAPRDEPQQGPDQQPLAPGPPGCLIGCGTTSPPATRTRKVSPALKLTTLRRVGRRVTVAGTVGARASGRVTIRYRVRIRGRARTVTQRVAIARRAFRTTLMLSTTVAAARSAAVSVVYAGDADTVPQTRTATVHTRA